MIAPTGPSRISRGWGWNAATQARVRAGYRLWFEPAYKVDNLGFRTFRRGRQLAGHAK